VPAKERPTFFEINIYGVVSDTIHACSEKIQRRVGQEGTEGEDGEKVFQEVGVSSGFSEGRTVVVS